MKITQSMVHPDLRPTYRMANMLPFLMKRRWSLKLMALGAEIALKGKNVDGLVCSEQHAPGRADGYPIRLRVYKPKPKEDLADQAKLPLMLYIHGGGYITGIPEIAHESIERFIAVRPCVVVAPDYRKAYVKPFPAGLNDCYDTVLWAIENSDQLGIDPGKIIVAGHSGGGGLTAALTLKARDTQDFQIAFQMPIYPMIDDQQPADPDREIDSPCWNTTMNRVGWSAYLADLTAAGQDVPAYAAPIRNADYAAFPPTFVGTLEPFYWETVRYVEDLRQAGVEVAFKEYADCFHGFDVIGGDTPIGKDALDFTYSQYADFCDRYLGLES